MRSDKRKEKNKKRNKVFFLLIVLIIVFIVIILCLNNKSSIEGLIGKIRQSLEDSANNSETSDLQDTDISTADYTGIKTDYVSELIENISYYESGDSKIKLNGILENGAAIYNDDNATFESIPYRYWNAEYIQLPNSDKAIISDKLISFNALKDIDVIIFRDSTLKKVKWLNNYTIAEDIVLGSNGVIYDVYMKSFKRGDNIIIASNNDGNVDTTNGWMNIIALKETYKVKNSIFYQDDLENLNAWKYVIQNDTNVEHETIDGENTLHFIDNNDNTIAYIYRQFPNLTESYTLDYSYVVHPTLNGAAINNNYVRILLNQGPPPSDILNLSNSNLQTHISDTTKWSYRANGASTELGMYDFKTVDVWHKIQYKVNSITEKFDCIIDEKTATTSSSFFSKNLGGTNYVVFGTARAHKNNFNIKDLSITPNPKQTIKSISIDGNVLSVYNYFTVAYRAKGDEASVITIEKGENYASHTIEKSVDEKTFILKVKDTEGVERVYKIFIEKGIINKTELRSLLSQAEAIDLRLYTNDSAENLMNKIKDGNIMLNNGNVKLNDLQLIIENLREAINKLEINRN